MNTVSTARYEILNEVARGGMGSVHRVLDRQFGRVLAIKLIAPKLLDHPESIRRFLQEARISGQLQHPGIPPIHEVGRLPDGQPFFTMKLIEGQTLAEWLRRKTRSRGHDLGPLPMICKTLSLAWTRAVQMPI